METFDLPPFPIIMVDTAAIEFLLFPGILQVVVVLKRGCYCEIETGKTHYKSRVDS